MSTDTTAADDWAETFEGQVLDGRYEIEGLLGAGGMGAVFRGRQMKLRKPVAIKLLRPEYGHRKIYRERFLREARAASRIGHRNVVDISDFGETEDGRVFFVMELLEGEDLARTLRREGPMPWRRARGILLQIVRALKAAHAKSVIHRDVKPANIFLVKTPDDEPDEIKMLDFGVAKVTDPADSAAEGLTSADKVMGTAMYMAPEQALGKVADARSDVYAVGCVAYQILAGRPAFPGTNALEILMRRINEPPPSLADELPHIASEVEAFVRRAMAREPMARFQSMKEMEDAIREIAADIPSRGPEPPTLPTAAAAAPPAADTDAPATWTSERLRAGRAPAGLPHPVGPTPPSGVPTETIAKPSDEAAGAGLTEPAPRPSRAGLEDADTPATAPSLEIVTASPARSRAAFVIAPVLVGLSILGAWLSWDRLGSAPEDDRGERAAAVSPTQERRVTPPAGTAESLPPARSDAPVGADPSPLPVGGSTEAQGEQPADDSVDPAEPPATEAPPSPSPPPPVEPAAKRRPRSKTATKSRTKAPPAPRDVPRTNKLLAGKAKARCTAAPGTSITVSFNVEASGKPTMVHVPSGTAPELSACLRSLVRGAQFGVGEVEAATLVVTW